MMRRLFLVLLLGLATACCNGNGGNDDSGLPDADGVDAGGDESEEPFKLTFADGAQACAQFMIQRTAAQELALRGRIVFVPGAVMLSRNLDRFEGSLIDEVYLTGPEPVTAQPDGLGEFTHEYQQEVWGYIHHYTYTQTFHAGARPFNVEAVFSFRYRDNVADPDELIFDADRVGDEPKAYEEEHHQVSIRGFLDNGADYTTERQAYRSCTFATLPRFRITADVEGGDSIVLYKRYLKPLMGTGPAAAVRAEVNLDGEQRIVEDYFKIAYAADPHNFNERYLVVLNPPIGSIHGVHFEEANQNDPPAAVDLLDADLAPAGQRNITGYTDEELP